MTPFSPGVIRHTCKYIRQERGPKAMWAVQLARALRKSSLADNTGRMGRDRESQVIICLEWTAGWSPQAGQWFLKSKLCLRRKQMNWWCRMLFWVPLKIWGGGHQVESSVGRVGQVGAGAGTKSRAWGLEENFYCRCWLRRARRISDLFPMIPNRVLGENGMCGLIMSQQRSLLSLKIGME